MKTTCGIIIYNELDQILAGHVTNTSHWSVPKGIAEENEEHIKAALRELFEETGLILEEKDLVDLGIHSYLPKKQFHVYSCRGVEIQIENCQCTSMIVGKNQPEICAYRWVSSDDIEYYFNKNQAKLLRKLV